jgi:DNA-binding MarR family transcriptional regulator
MLTSQLWRYAQDVDRLSDEEMALWHAWKLASETVRTRIAADITAGTGLSDPDFGVLTRIVEIGGGRLRQNRLAELMGYHRSRLSHHLTRMEERGLISREPSGGGVDVAATPAGFDAVRKARPVHASAVRSHLVDLLTDTERMSLLSALQKLAPVADNQSGGSDPQAQAV